MKTRPKGKPFQPGQSGNPSGRAKINPEVKAMASARTEDAINVLTTVMLDKKQPGSTRVQAAVAILDRAHGRPAVSVEMNAKHQYIGEEIVKVTSASQYVPLPPSDE